MRMDTGMDTCTVIWLGTCIDIGMDMYIGMCIDGCTRTCIDICTRMCICIAEEILVWSPCHTRRRSYPWGGRNYIGLNCICHNQLAAAASIRRPMLSTMHLRQRPVRPWAFELCRDTGDVRARPRLAGVSARVHVAVDEVDRGGIPVDWRCRPPFVLLWTNDAGHRSYYP